MAKWMPGLKEPDCLRWLVILKLLGSVGRLPLIPYQTETFETTRRQRRRELEEQERSHLESARAEIFYPMDAELGVTRWF